jgi:hypothetical protein
VLAAEGAIGGEASGGTRWPREKVDERATCIFGYRPPLVEVTALAAFRV